MGFGTLFFGPSDAHYLKEINGCLVSLRGTFGRGVTLLCRAMTIQTLSGRRRSRTEFYLESHGSTGESGDLITCGWKVPTE